MGLGVGDRKEGNGVGVPRGTGHLVSRPFTNSQEAALLLPPPDPPAAESKPAD